MNAVILKQGEMTCYTSEILVCNAESNDILFCFVIDQSQVPKLFLLVPDFILCPNSYRVYTSRRAISINNMDDLYNAIMEILKLNDYVVNKS